MTNAVEVVDPLEEGKAQAKCFGQYDANYVECTRDCALSPQCKRFTEQAPKAAPPAPPLEEVETLSDISAHDFLIQTLKGRYDVQEKKKGSLTNYLCFKDGAGVAQVGSLADGRYLIRTQNATLQINSIDSTQQALAIFKAIISA